MPANNALQSKNVAEIGTYPYNCVAYRVFMFAWCGYV